MGTQEWEFIGVVLTIISLATLYIKLSIRNVNSDFIIKEFKTIERVIRLEADVLRLKSDAESEKGTRARANGELHTHIQQSEERISNKIDQLDERIRNLEINNKN